MVYDYLITLKRPDYKTTDLVSQLLYLIAFVVFIYLATRMVSVVNIYSVAALVVLVSYVFVKRKIRREGVAYYTPGLAIATVTWLAGAYSSWLMFGLYLVSTLVERELKFKKEIGFTDDEVVFNTLIKKPYEYSEFKNLLIKDGILTLDFKNNKIVQREIDGEVTLDIETEFNQYCQQRLMRENNSSSLQ